MTGGCFRLRQLPLEKFQSSFPGFLLIQRAGKIAPERGDLAFSQLDLTLKILTRSFDVLPPRSELIRLPLPFLELSFFNRQRLEDGAELVVGLFQLVLLDRKLLFSGRDVCLVLLHQGGRFADALLVEINPVGGGIDLVFQFLNSLSPSRNLLFQEIDLTALLANTEFLRFNLFLQGPLNVAQPLDLFLRRRDRQLDIVMTGSTEMSIQSPQIVIASLGILLFVLAVSFVIPAARAASIEPSDAIRDE